jgi:hypothetical protein
MADKKISQLNGATTPLAGTEEVPLVQSGETKKVSVDNLTAGKAVSALSMTATNLKTSPATANLDISGTSIIASGTNTNVPINVTPKGTSSVNIITSTSGEYTFPVQIVSTRDTRTRMTFQVGPVTNSLVPLVLQIKAVAQRPGQGVSVSAQGIFHACDKEFYFQVFSTDGEVYSTASNTRLIRVWQDAGIKIESGSSAAQFELIIEHPTGPAGDAVTAVAVVGIISTYNVQLVAVVNNEAIPP